MKRYEAFITKNWRDTGIANVVVARIDDGGGASAGFFLVDHFCLGVKDAFLLDDLTESELRKIIEERFPDGKMERMHPAWAKKFVEGAVAYADNLGLSPHRDYRKARRALSGIDTSICTETFTYGNNGRPHFIQGDMEDEERAARIIAALNARVGPDGYYVLLRDDMSDEPDVSGEAIDETRAQVKRALEKMKSEFTLPMVSGIITSMLCHPGGFTCANVINEFAMDKDTDGKPFARHDLSTLGNLLKIYWAQLEERLDRVMKNDDPWPIDLYAKDYHGEEEYFLAMLQWSYGFIYVVEIYQDAWAGALARPELAKHWEVLNQWGKPEAPGGLFEKLREKTAGTKTGDAGKDENTGKDDAGDGGGANSSPPAAVVAIYRALHAPHSNA